jgi:hypothetical protein
MNHLIVVTVVLALAGILLAGAWFARRERFVPGYALEKTINGYSAVVGDRRTMAQQYFGVDDSIRGVFSARIQTPKEDYIKLIVPADNNPYRGNNMRLAATARCNLVCSKDDATYLRAPKIGTNISDLGLYTV